jgi:hypothetical protein
MDSLLMVVAEYLAEMKMVSHCIVIDHYDMNLVHMMVHHPYLMVVD